MKSQKISLFIFAGEPSGDLHASHLIKALPEYSFSGVAGPLMRALGMETYLPMEKFAVMGFSDVIKALPRLYKQFYAIRDHILKSQPAAVVFVDYPGFNLRMAKALRKKGYQGKLIHYISPTVWAWKKKRIDQMAKTLDMLLTIYPFEKEHFSHTSLNVQYVGNPLKEYISKYSYEGNWQKQFYENQDTLIAIFPGSREGEVYRNLPKMLQAAALFQKKYPETAFGISCANPLVKHVIDKMVTEQGLNKAFTVPPRYTYELMQSCHSAMAKSGTVTLELALHQKPTVVVYELTNLNWFIAKFLIRLNMPHYCIVNILSNKRVFPELIEKGFNKKNLFQQLENIHTGPAREACLDDCLKLKDMLQHNQASLNAAKAIRDLMS